MRPQHIATQTECKSSGAHLKGVFFWRDAKPFRTGKTREDAGASGIHWHAPSSNIKTMRPWVESLGVLALAAGGVLIGARFSRLPKPWWMLGYFIPLLAVVLYAVALHFPALSFVPPVSWMMAGRNKFAVTGFMGAVLLTTPMLKMPRRRERIVVSVLMVCLVLGTSVWPFLAPAFNQSYFASLPTFVDEDGVCRQSTTYTCGPASAVTALRKLGFPAEEGQIAILAHTSSSIGTPPDI